MSLRSAEKDDYTSDPGKVYQRKNFIQLEVI